MAYRTGNTLSQGRFLLDNLQHQQQPPLYRPIFDLFMYFWRIALFLKEVLAKIFIGSLQIYTY